MWVHWQWKTLPSACRSRLVTGKQGKALSSAHPATIPKSPMEAVKKFFCLVWIFPYGSYTCLISLLTLGWVADARPTQHVQLWICCTKERLCSCSSKRSLSSLLLSLTPRSHRLLHKRHHSQRQPTLSMVRRFWQKSPAGSSPTSLPVPIIHHPPTTVTLDSPFSSHMPYIARNYIQPSPLLPSSFYTA